MSSSLPIELQQKLAELHASLLNRSPQISTILQTIHTTLKSQPENVTLLSEEEIQTIVEGLKMQTQTQFAISSTKGSAKSAGIAKIKADVAGSLGL